MATSTDELMLVLGALPAGSDVRLFFPGLDADTIVNEAARRSGSRLLEKIDANTIRAPLSDVVFVPVPGEELTNQAALISVTLPAGIIKGQEFRVVVHQLSRSRQRVQGTFELVIPVKTKDDLLDEDERRLSVLKHIFGAIPAGDRWRSLFQRNIEEVGARVRGLGVDPDHIGPSPDGTGGRTTWKAGTAYKIGSEVVFKGLDYRCRQAHTAQTGWEPPNTFALWARIFTGGLWAPQVLYQASEQAIFNGQSFTVIQGHQSQIGWEPPNVPALWRLT
jgi:Carbohydrate-binding module family 5/12